MRKAIIRLTAFMLLLSVWSCSDDEPATTAPDDREWVEHTVAVVLPMEKGLQNHWHRCLDLFARNFERAFKSQAPWIKLRFEYHDECI